jgi:hypothetical protein
MSGKTDRAATAVTVHRSRVTPRYAALSQRGCPNFYKEIWAKLGKAKRATGMLPVGICGRSWFWPDMDEGLRLAPRRVSGVR